MNRVHRWSQAMTHRVALSPFSISCAILFAAPIVLAQNEDFATVKQLVEERFDSIESYSADVKTRMNLGSVTMNFGGTIRVKGAMS